MPRLVALPGVWCTHQEATVRYPIADLFAHMAGSDDDCRRRLGISGGAYGPMVQRGLTFDQAERYAERAGLIPEFVWPEIVDELIERESRECAADGCTERFVPENPRRIYCSNLCRDRRHKADWFRRRYQSDPEFRARQIERTNQYHHDVIVPARQRRKASA